ncbi:MULTISPECIES: hypothetical protein [unclassified Nocardioides]|uniref:hypothetical protein n=1 Tax=unclassified Nocardioides TaxID=2615069 RepID=UPI0009EFDE50|nr:MULTISPECIES: hypothetical protein [unclassified Nocardioides]GAW55523.1 Osmosensitive K channel histidine kinase [Nocardioides sp. PD653]
MPWQTITAAAGGWTLFGFAMLGLLTGRLVTKREADVYLARAEKAEAHVDVLLTAVAETTTIGKLQKAVIDAGIRASTTISDGDGP